jgi:predicted transglutaminase-like cysteine proteinase
MHMRYLVTGLAGVILIGSLGYATASTMHLDEIGPAAAPFAHTRFCLRYPDDCKEKSKKDTVKQRTLSPNLLAQLKAVNAGVNRQIEARPQNEPVAKENWILHPDEGDCNDYAVTKRHGLIGIGWPIDTLLLTEVSLPSGEHHLVLIVRTNEGDLVLDNLKPDVRTLAEANADYKWVRMVSSKNPIYWSTIRATL